MAITILITMLAMPTLLGLFALKQMTETQPRPVGVSPRRASVNPGLRITRQCWRSRCAPSEKGVVDAIRRGLGWRTAAIAGGPTSAFLEASQGEVNHVLYGLIGSKIRMRGMVGITLSAEQMAPHPRCGDGCSRRSHPRSTCSPNATAQGQKPNISWSAARTTPSRSSARSVRCRPWSMYSLNWAGKARTQARRVWLLINS